MTLELINVGAQADDGTGDPDRTAFQKTNAVIEAMRAHLLDVANPHKTTAAQADTYSKAEIDTKIADTITLVQAGVISPAQLIEALQGLANEGYVDAAVEAVNATIATLTTGAPGTLDTFLEAYNRFLANESAASALTAAVGSKAPLASPAFTGEPTAPTPAPGDNSTKLSTTAFVGAAIAAAISGGSTTGDDAVIWASAF